MNRYKVVKIGSWKYWIVDTKTVTANCFRGDHSYASVGSFHVKQDAEFCCNALNEREKAEARRGNELLRLS